MATVIVVVVVVVVVVLVVVVVIVIALVAVVVVEKSWPGLVNTNWGRYPGTEFVNTT